MTTALLAVSFMLACIGVRAEYLSGAVVYYSTESNFQSSLAVALEKRLGTSGQIKRTRFVTDDDLSSIQPDDLIISLGSHESTDDKIAALDNPVLYINDTSSSSNANRQNKHYTNINITQPICRSLRLIRALDKKWKYVGYLSSNPEDNRYQQLQNCAHKLDLQVINALAETRDSIPDAVDKLLHDSNVLLALPDSKIYDRHSVKNILLSAYRSRIPVIGFSENFVKAGALAAVHTTPEQLAEQVADIILMYSTTGIFSSDNQASPEHFSVSINDQVAKSLGIAPPDISGIESMLRNLEATR